MLNPFPWPRTSFRGAHHRQGPAHGPPDRGPQHELISSANAGSRLDVAGLFRAGGRVETALPRRRVRAPSSSGWQSVSAPSFAYITKSVPESKGAVLIIVPYRLLSGSDSQADGLCAPIEGSGFWLNVLDGVAAGVFLSVGSDCDPNDTLPSLTRGRPELGGERLHSAVSGLSREGFRRN
jgi:hypothetical protein